MAALEPVDVPERILEEATRLFVAILNANLDRLGGLIQVARQQGTTTREQVSGMMHAIFDQAPNQRAIIRLASQEMMHLSQEARAEFGRAYQISNVKEARGK